MILKELAPINFSFCRHVLFDKSPHRPFLVFGIFILVYGLKRIPEHAVFAIHSTVLQIFFFCCHCIKQSS
ncbi:hypothetical protein QYF36_014128 [Acer negundo]|nr:hypothetical protein QYF36_014128 [Acer negundo]